LIVPEFGSAKSFYKTTTGRKDLQALIYHLIVEGIICEVSVGTPERPSIVIHTGDVLIFYKVSKKFVLSIEILHEEFVHLFTFMVLIALRCRHSNSPEFSGSLPEINAISGSPDF
jgi:hypothetical protein